MNCPSCPDRKPFEEYGKHHSYCGQLGLFEDFPILIVDYWMEVNSSPIFCPVKFPKVVEGWKKGEWSVKCKIEDCENEKHLSDAPEVFQFSIPFTAIEIRIFNWNRKKEEEYWKRIWNYQKAASPKTLLDSFL